MWLLCPPSEESKKFRYKDSSTICGNILCETSCNSRTLYIYVRIAVPLFYKFFLNTCWKNDAKIKRLAVAKKAKKKNKDDRIVISLVFNHVNFGANCFIKFHLWVQQIIALYGQIYYIYIYI